MVLNSDNMLIVRLSGFPVGERERPYPGKLGASESAGEKDNSVRLTLTKDIVFYSSGFTENQGYPAPVPY